MLKLPFKKRADGWVAGGVMPSVRWLAIRFALLVICVGAVTASAQDFGPQQPGFALQTPAPFQQVIPVEPPAVSNAAATESRTAAKPVIDSNAGEMGATYIALDSRLKQVFRGSEPKSLAELRAMDEQQSKVAAVIDQVTVNVQQGSAQGSGAVISGDG